jgi:hypothetical protein
MPASRHGAGVLAELLAELLGRATTSAEPDGVGAADSAELGAGEGGLSLDADLQPKAAINGNKGSETSQGKRARSECMGRGLARA